MVCVVASGSGRWETQGWEGLEERCLLRLEWCGVHAVACRQLTMACSLGVSLWAATCRSTLMQVGPAICMACPTGGVGPLSSQQKVWWQLEVFSAQWQAQLICNLLGSTHTMRHLSGTQCQHPKTWLPSQSRHFQSSQNNHQQSDTHGHVCWKKAERQPDVYWSIQVACPTAGK